MTLSTSAVLVGINHYRNLPDTMQLHGAANDARAWYSMTLVTGSDPDHCAALTSVATDAGYFGPEEMLPERVLGAGFDDGRLHCGLATKQAIETAITRLIEGICGHPARQGLLVFAGHGAQSDEGLLLCPCDVELDDLQNTAVPLSFVEDEICRVKQSLRSQGKDDSLTLTIVLDTCFAGSAASQTRLRTVTPGQGRGHAVDSLGEHALLLMSSKAGESSYEYNFGANMLLQRAVHGVFTSSMMEMLERWRMKRLSAAGHQLRFWPVSYKNLADSTAAVLHALKFNQHSWFAGPPDTQDMPALRANYRVLPELVKHGIVRILRRNLDPWTPPGREIDGDWTDAIWGNLQDPSTTGVVGWGLVVRLPANDPTTTTALAFYTVASPPTLPSFLESTDAVPQQLLGTSGTGPNLQSVVQLSLSPPAPANSKNCLMLRLSDSDGLCGLLISYQFSDTKGDAQEFIVLYTKDDGKLPDTFTLEPFATSDLTYPELYQHAVCSGEGVEFSPTQSTPNSEAHYGATTDDGTATCTLHVDSSKITWFNSSSDPIVVDSTQSMYFGGDVTEDNSDLDFTAADPAWP